MSLTAANANGSGTLSLPNYIAVDLFPPVADFSARPTAGISPLSVSFTDQSSGGTATAWSWSFGDGSTSTLQNPGHVYTGQGNYRVALTASNADGSSTLTRLAYIQVTPTPPLAANFVGSPTLGPAPLQVDFTDMSVGNVVAWDWSFGDGGTSTLQNPSHVFSAAGSYDIALTVNDPNGGDDCLELQAYVVVQ